MSKSFGQKEVAQPVIHDDFRRSWDNRVSLTARWNIYDGGKAKENYKSKKKKSQEVEINYQNKANNIYKKVEDYYISLNTSKDNMMSSFARSKKQQEIFYISKMRLKAGVTNQREIINNQRDLLIAEIDLIDAISTYNINLSQLQLETGIEGISKCEYIKDLIDINSGDIETSILSLDNMSLNSPCSVISPDISLINTRVDP